MIFKKFEHVIQSIYIKKKNTGFITFYIVPLHKNTVNAEKNVFQNIRPSITAVKDPFVSLLYCFPSSSARLL